VLVDDLRVVDFVGVLDYPYYAQEALVHLGPGTEILLTDGPITAAGAEFYEARFTLLAGDPFTTAFGLGWIKVGSEGGTPTAIRIDPPRCPEVVTAEAIGSMSRLARRQCLTGGSHEVTGVMAGCPDELFPGEPAWMFSRCRNLLTSAGVETGLSLYFSPGVDGSKPEDGDAVRVLGHVGDPAADECRRADGSVDPRTQQRLVLTCASLFVVSEIEVIENSILPG
jgi:hypothetical protein